MSLKLENLQFLCQLIRRGYWEEIEIRVVRLMKNTVYWEKETETKIGI